MRLENDDGLSELLASGEETRLCTGFEFTEGPIWVAADEALLFSDIPGNRIHRWRPGSDAAEVYREPSGHSNGLTLDADGQLLACEHSGRRVSRATYVARGGNGAGTDVVAAFEGKRFNSPNDLVMHSSGRLYFTDPTYGLPRPGARRVMGDPDARKELDFQGVYLFDADGTLTLLVDEFTQPNGLAFSPDEEVLYRRRLTGPHHPALRGRERRVAVGGRTVRGHARRRPSCSFTFNASSRTRRAESGRLRAA